LPSGEAEASWHAAGFMAYISIARIAFSALYGVWHQGLVRRSMHETALKFASVFFNTHLRYRTGLTIVDLGSQDISGSIKSVAPPGNKYVGVDFVAGRGVDIVISDPYNLPFDSEFADVVVSSSCFEHSEFFWLVYNEILRTLKPSGLFYLDVPSNGPFHRYPVDCWRFYPDSGVALQNWGRRSGHKGVALLESFTGRQETQMWNDFVAVFLKDERHINQYPSRIQDHIASYTNALAQGRPTFANPAETPEDQEMRSSAFGRNKPCPCGSGKRFKHCHGRD
jgi:SAM-dependent methyltransferase